MKCLYRIAEHEVYRFPMPVIDSNMYLIPENDNRLIIDPNISAEAERILAKLQIRECTVLLTHEHYDHISGVNRLRERYPCQVICSETCANGIRDPKKNAARYFEAMFLNRDNTVRAFVKTLIDTTYTCCADETYKGQLKLRWNGLILQLTETQGHSPGSQCIRIENCYFTGDTLIQGQSVITRFPGGSKKSYEEMARPYVKRILPGSMIFPGHGQEFIYHVEQNEEE